MNTGITKTTTKSMKKKANWTHRIQPSRKFTWLPKTEMFKRQLGRQRCLDSTWLITCSKDSTFSSCQLCSRGISRTPSLIYETRKKTSKSSSRTAMIKFSSSGTRPISGRKSASHSSSKASTSLSTSTSYWSSSCSSHLWWLQILLSLCA